VFAWRSKNIEIYARTHKHREKCLTFIVKYARLKAEQIKVNRYICSWLPPTPNLLLRLFFCAHRQNSNTEAVGMNTTKHLLALLLAFIVIFTNGATVLAACEGRCKDNPHCQASHDRDTYLKYEYYPEAAAYCATCRTRYLGKNLCQLPRGMRAKLSCVESSFDRHQQCIVTPHPRQ